MNSAYSSAQPRRSIRSVSLHSRRVRAVARLMLPLVVLAGCTEQSIVEPTRTATPSASQPVVPAHASVVVAANYSAFDTRAEFNAAGDIDHLNGFDEFTGELLYIQSTPWTTNGVTYTSGLNIVLGPGIGLGVQSNSLSTEFGAPLTGQFTADDAFTLFGADVTLIGVKVPVSVVISTTVGNYAFANLDVPLATTGRRFFGVALTQAGEYLTGVRVTIPGSNSAVLLDNVAVGHAASAGNADPDISVGGAYTGLEGSAVTLAMSGSDTDGDALTYSWDLGDGTTGSGPTPPSSHTYADNGAYDVMLAVEDGRGGVDTARTTATISNVAPVVAPFSVPTSTLGMSVSGVTLPISTTFTDPGSLDTHTATLDCGVGPAVQSSAPNGSASGTCAFSAPGVYTIKLTVLDDDGGSDTEIATGQVVVYDPSAGWVTGGGWIASPVGGYSAASSAGGKLTFALTARYQPGATVPSGTADFKLNLAKLDYRATAFDWLVVTGSSVHMQGRGTLNGSADYSFEVVANDGASGDTIRIRIWNRLTGAVVYDNKPVEPLDGGAAAALGGGSIQVHQY